MKKYEYDNKGNLCTDWILRGTNTIFFFKDAIMLLPYVKEFLYFTGSD